jgi:hypothetical protein
MPVLSTATAAVAAASGGGRELRVWERYPLGVDTCCQPVAARGDQDLSWPACIRDVSGGGLGLVLGRRFERGAGLAIEIPATTDCPGDTLLARVVHVTRLPDGRWLHGCAFINPIGDDEIRRLLRLAPPIPDAAPPDSPPEAERQDAPAKRPPHVVRDVTLIGSWRRRSLRPFRVRNLFLSGDWPLSPGAILRVHAGRHPAAQARLEITGCQRHGQGWSIRCVFLDAPPADFARAFDLD